MSDSDLESAAGYYLWLATSFPDMQNVRLGEIVSEAARRGKPEIMERARASVYSGDGGGSSTSIRRSRRAEESSHSGG